MEKRIALKMAIRRQYLKFLFHKIIKTLGSIHGKITEDEMAKRHLEIIGKVLTHCKISNIYI